MFDPSAPHIIILLVVVLVLFGSTRLPGAAQALGKSMHIFKKSVKGLDENGKPLDDASAQVTAAQPPTLPGRVETPASQADVQDLQRQLAELKDLQRQAAGGGDAASGAARSETPRDQTSS
jgi:sec-independent protein translocase protein TatA